MSLLKNSGAYKLGWREAKRGEPRPTLTIPEGAQLPAPFDVIDALDRAQRGWDDYHKQEGRTP